MGRRIEKLGRLLLEKLPFVAAAGLLSGLIYYTQANNGATGVADGPKSPERNQASPRATCVDIAAG